MAKLSIIVTVFNLESYIHDCLESIFKQGFSDYEVIIVNDGSTDNSKSVINGFFSLINMDDRYHLVNTSNSGVASARNLALSICKGEYIMFIDGDDYITADCLSVAMRSIDDFDILVFNYSKVSEGKVINSVDYKAEDLQKKNHYNLAIEAIELEPNPWGKLYRRNVFNNVKYPEGLFFEDYAVFYKLFYLKRVKFINDALYFYRIRQGSIMRTFNDKKIFDKYSIVHEMENDLMSFNSEEIRLAFINSYLFHFVFVTSNIIFNSSKSPLSDIKKLSALCDPRIYNFKNIFFSKSLSKGVKCYLVLNKVSPCLTFFVKGIKRYF